jgi:hypothetical protein
MNELGKTVGAYLLLLLTTGDPPGAQGLKANGLLDPEVLGTEGLPAM